MFQYRCALAYILIAHHLSNVADINGEEQPRKEAFQAIDEAIKVFTEVGLPITNDNNADEVTALLQKKKKITPK